MLYDWLVVRFFVFCIFGHCRRDEDHLAAFPHTRTEEYADGFGLSIVCHAHHVGEQDISAASVPHDGHWGIVAVWEVGDLIWRQVVLDVEFPHLDHIGDHLFVRQPQKLEEREIVGKHDFVVPFHLHGRVVSARVFPKRRRDVLSEVRIRRKRVPHDLAVGGNVLGRPGRRDRTFLRRHGFAARCVACLNLAGETAVSILIAACARREALDALHRMLHLVDDLAECAPHPPVVRQVADFRLVGPGDSFILPFDPPPRVLALLLDCAMLDAERIHVCESTADELVRIKHSLVGVSKIPFVRRHVL